MIIWINGTFGAGKTTAAYELQKRVKNSFVFDPERFGYVLMRNDSWAYQQMEWMEIISP